jgi:long-chain fatty acid transport protein
MRRGLHIGVTLLLLNGYVSAVMGQGIIFPSAGPINSSMAGASVAAPVDLGGAYWNPAIISGLSSQEYLLGSALILPDISLQSTLPARSILGQFPPTTRSGTAVSSSGVAANLATGVSFRMTEDSPLTMGIGVFGLVGGSVNFAGSNNVPVLTPSRPPRYFGVGPIASNLALLAISPMASYQFTDKLAIGGGPIITSGSANFNPAFFAPTPGTLGLPTFPGATNSHPYWGAGFQVGLLYELNENWNLGFSYKSPIWQQKWDYNASYKDNSARHIGVQAQFPAIYSWGIAYKGIPKALIDLDLRYMDYANTLLFGQKLTDGGLDWKSVFAVALGGQYAVTDKLTLRAGYLFNTNPIPAPLTLFNVQAPVITEHTLSMGASYAMTENVTFSLAWMHGFDNAIQGSILQIPGSSIRLTTQTDLILGGVNVTFGPRKKKIPAETPPVEYQAPAETPPVVDQVSSVQPPVGDQVPPLPPPVGDQVPSVLSVN